jgi:hypothetical protein
VVPERGISIRGISIHESQSVEPIIIPALWKSRPRLVESQQGVQIS